jgi:hypothetical protein
VLGVHRNGTVAGICDIESGLPKRRIENMRASQ